MLLNLQHAPPPTNPQAGIVLVGAGAAGITLAVELARLGHDVTLLEAGGLTLEDSPQDPFQTELPGLPHRGVHEGRVRMHGGTTNKWGGQILELEDADFQPHPWIPASGWPFPKSTLALHYARALQLEGLARALPTDHAVWRALRLNPPSLNNLGLYLSRWCPEPNFARLHRQTLATHPRITVYLHAPVVELLLDDHNAATGLRCLTPAGQSVTFHASRYIFTLGTVESNRFFLQPRPDGGQLPWNQSGLLGRHFQDHIDADAAVLTPHSPHHFHQIFDSIFLRGFKYNPKLRLTRAAQQQHRTLAAGGTIFSASSADEALAQVKTTAKHLLRGRLSQLSAADLASLLRHAPLAARQTLRFLLQHRSFHPAGAEIRLRVHCEQQPDSASTITLSDQRDQFGLLRTRLHWAISPLELHTVRTFVQTAAASLAPLATITPNPDLASDASFLPHCQDSFHHMGGMRMAASPAEGIVDPNLRLHNTANLYVCSAATFPTSGFSNPTHTLLALALRLANHLPASI